LKANRAPKFKTCEFSLEEFSQSKKMPCDLQDYVRIMLPSSTTRLGETGFAVLMEMGLIMSKVERLGMEDEAMQ
jgi:hypothetical protein